MKKEDVAKRIYSNIYFRERVGRGVHKRLFDGREIESSFFRRFYRNLKIKRRHWK